jgi:DNA-binding NtrC family response regulator
MSGLCKIFVADDDVMYSEILGHYLSLNPDNEVHKFNSSKTCLQALPKIKPKIITLDYNMPESNGRELLKKIKEYDNTIQVIIISGQEDIKTALNLLKEGAYDYFVKDDDTKEKLWNVVNKIREFESLKRENDNLRTEVKSKYQIDKILKGNSPEISNIHQIIEKASKTNISVSVFGETGTGKELAAKAIHYNSLKANKPFIAVNIASLPNDLIESELFGYEKGAFTGAQNRRIGKMEEANGGTLFLDEIGEMDLSIQSKLLRALQEREISRLGSNQIIKLDFRLIVATHKNLQNEVKLGNFREDLYYRIFGFPIELPSLRSRGQDIILLANYFIKLFCTENKINVVELTKSAKEKLLKYPWPGNVRELKAVIELAVVMTNSNEISENEISFNPIDSKSNILLQEMTMEQYQKEIINSYLKKYNNNVVLVAQKLNMGKSTIYNMLQKKEI